jgi:hypothetical protein
MNLEPHKLAEKFPLMDPDRLAELADDIKKNGQLQPIVLHEGKILDGRNRYMAARMAGREPITEEFNANEVNRSAEEFVWSMNLQRRDLTPSQRAAIAAELADKLRERPQAYHKRLGRAIVVRRHVVGRSCRARYFDQIPRRSPHRIRGSALRRLPGLLLGRKLCTAGNHASGAHLSRALGETGPLMRAGAER